MEQPGTNNGMCVDGGDWAQGFCERHQALLRDLARHAVRSAQQAPQPAAGEVEGPKPPSQNTALLSVRVPPEDKKALRLLQLETGRKGPDLLREALRLLLREYGRGVENARP